MVDDTESDGRYDGTHVGFKEVRAHSGDIADVVTDVVGDNSGVAGIILGDTCLDFTDKVSADVCSLGVDAAADSREQCD